MRRQEPYILLELHAKTPPPERHEVVKDERGEEGRIWGGPKTEGEADAIFFSIYPGRITYPNIKQPTTTAQSCSIRRGGSLSIG